MLQSSKYNNLLSLNEILFYYLPQGKIDQNKHKRKAVSLFFFVVITQPVEQATSWIRIYVYIIIININTM